MMVRDLDSSTVAVRNVVQCSSEDVDHPGSNVTNKLNKTWRCSRKEAATGRACITLELESATFIQSLEIINAGSAFVQVDGQTSERSGLVPLLPVKMLMSEQDCRNSNVSAAYTSTHHFERSQFAPDSFKRFKFLVVTVTQPFKLGYPFGIGRLSITKPQYSDTIRKQSPGLSDPNKAKDIEFSFMKQSPKKQSLKERIFGLNDAVNDENFEMKKTAPMNRLDIKTKEKSKAPKRNSYFATLNEQHNFLYKTPRPSKKSSGAGKTIKSASKSENLESKENKENSSADNDISLNEDQRTPSRKRKMSKLTILQTSSPGNKKRTERVAETRKEEDPEEDLPSFTLTVTSDDDEVSTSRSIAPLSRSPTFITGTTETPSRYSASNITKTPDSTTKTRSISANTTPSSSKSQRNSSSLMKRTSPEAGEASRSPSFLSVSPGRCFFTKSPDLKEYKRNITEVSSGKSKTPKRVKAHSSWIAVDSSLKSKDKSNTTSGNKTPTSRKTKSSITPSSSKSRERPSTSRWNSTVTGRSPKFITILDVEDTESSKRSRKESDTDSSGLVIVDERSSRSTPNKFQSSRISVTNANRIRLRNDDDDDVLVCNPLPVERSLAVGKDKTSVAGKNKISVVDLDLVPCPLCGDSFLKFRIQSHANNCIDSLNNPK